MVHPVLLGGALLRLQRASLPRTFCRYKSFTQALERARHSPSDGFSSPPRTASRGRRDGRDEKNSRDRRAEVAVPRAQKIDRARELYLSSRGPAPSSASRHRRSQERNFDAPPRRQRPFTPSDARSPKGDRFERRPFPASHSASKGFREHQHGDHEHDASTHRRERHSEPSDANVGRGRRFEGSEGSSSGRGTSRAFRERGQEDDYDKPPRNSPRRFESAPDRTEDRGKKFGRSRDPMSDGSMFRGSRRERAAEEQDESKSWKSSRNQPQVEPYVHVHFDRKGDNSRTPVPPYTDVRSERDSRKRPESSFQKTAEPSTFRTRAPESLPYSTAASEFIYGYSSVLAAVKANRRKLYNLYLHTRGANRDGLLQDRALFKNVASITEVGDEYLRALDKASSGRPHNGVVLEASPLPCPPITELNSVSVASATFNVAVDQQSTEDALVNGKQEEYPYKSAGWRHPLVLYVDGVLDEGNLGAMARSAYYLGVDAIITPTRQIAPWSHIALKASAGAAEAIPVFKVREPADFLAKSSRNGWRIYASDAIPPARQPSIAPESKGDGASSVLYTFTKSVRRLPADHCPVDSHPTILMMGAEGTGLKNSLLNLAHYKVGIRHGRDVDEIGVDSLNVSVAASLLCYEMLKKPSVVTKPEDALF